VKIVLSSFTHPYVVPNLNELLSSVEHKQILGSINCVLFGYQQSLKYLLLCSTEETHTVLGQHVGEKIMTKFTFLGELTL